MHVLIKYLNYIFYVKIFLFFSYDESGNCRGTPEFTPPSPTRLNWDLKEIMPKIEEATFDATKLLNVNIFFFLFFIV